jgi:hypothetical protein
MALRPRAVDSFDPLLFEHQNRAVEQAIRLLNFDPHIAQRKLERLDRHPRLPWRSRRRGGVSIRCFLLYRVGRALQMRDSTK